MGTTTKAFNSEPDYLDEALRQIARIEESGEVLDEVLNLAPFEGTNGVRASKLLSAALDIQRNAVPEAWRLLLAECEIHNQAKTAQIDAYDLQNKIYELTNRLEDVQILLMGVCSNYFSCNERSVNKELLYMNYREYSTLIGMANGLLFDLEKDYRKLHDEILPQESKSPLTSSPTKEPM